MQADRRPLHEGVRQRRPPAVPRRAALAGGRHGELRGRAGAGRGRGGRARLGPAGRGLQPHRSLHPGRHRPLRRAHPLDAVLLLDLPARRRRAGRRAPPDAADRLGPLPGEPAQGEDAPRRHPQAHRGQGRRRRPPAHPEGEGERRGRRGRAAGRGRRRPAPARGAAAGGDAGAEGAALRGSGRRPGRGRARGPATQGGRSPPKAASRRLGRRRRGPGELHPPPDHDPRRGQGRGPRRQRPAAREGPHPAVEVQRVRRDGDGEGDPPRPGGDHLRVQARRRRQVLEDRRPRRRPRPRPRGRVDPHRPDQREGQRRHRDPERGPRDDLPAGDPRVGHLPPLLGPPDPRARQGRERRRVDDRPRGDAPPADRRLHRHRQERGPQLHDREHPLPLDPGRGAAHPDRPQAARARGLRGHPPPAHPGGDRPQDRLQRAQVGGRRDGAAHPDAGLGGRPQHRAVQQHHPGGEGRARRRRAARS